MIDCFISGLTPEIRRDVMIHSPISIVKAVSLAKVYEEKYASTKPPKYTSSNSYNYRAPFNSNKPEINQKTNQTPLLQTPPTRPMNSTQRNPNIKRISPAEMQL
jgi:hypothetical protein